MVKVDDTGVGIEEGVNAGSWTVGLAVSGNAVGLPLADWQALDATRQQELRAVATAKLKAAGAHFVIDSVADLLPVLDEIDARLRQGLEALSGSSPQVGPLAQKARKARQAVVGEAVVAVADPAADGRRRLALRVREAGAELEALAVGAFPPAARPGARRCAPGR